jgi:TonB family protein
MDTVADVLVTRAPEPTGLRRMFAISIVGHIVLSIAFLLMPSPAPTTDDPEVAIELSLGGAPGPRVGGMTTMGGRAIQEVAKEPNKPQPITPPAAKTPEMTLPTAKTPPRPATLEAPASATSRKPTTGAETRAGSTKVETHGQGTATGLTMGGSGLPGGQFDSANFCCPEYLATMYQLINRNWSSKQQVAGRTVMRFTVERDGRISKIELRQTSGYFALDQAAQRALALTRQFPPLPDAYTDDQFTIDLTFTYVP